MQKRSGQKTIRQAAAALCAAAFFLGAAGISSAAQLAPPPQVSAKSAALLDGTTGECLYVKNGEQRALIASTTKIMTGLLVCEAGELDRTVTVPDAAVGLEGSSMYPKKDETLTRRDLLYGMMLHSGNDAALTLAISVSGSEGAFVRQMNLRARALGLTQTHFAARAGQRRKLFHCARSGPPCAGSAAKRTAPRGRLDQNCGLRGPDAYQSQQAALAL